jgi:hypothetical protein
VRGVRTRLRPLANCGAARRWTEDNLDSHPVDVRVGNLHNLVKALLADAGGRLHEQLVLPLDHGPAYGALAGGVTLDALLERHRKEEHHAGNLVLARQLQQILPRRRRQRRGIHHAQPIEFQSPFDQKMHQGEGLRLKALVALIVADEGPRLIRRDNLGGPEMASGKTRFAAGRRATEDDDRRPH